MPPVSTAEQERRGADFRHARDSVTEHLRAQAAAELERSAWMRRHRGVPIDVLFNRDTGEALDPELKALDDAVAKAEADVAWCEALTIACGEVFKGVKFADVPNNRTASVLHGASS